METGLISAGMSAHTAVTLTFTQEALNFMCLFIRLDCGYKQKNFKHVLESACKRKMFLFFLPVPIFRTFSAFTDAQWQQ